MRFARDAGFRPRASIIHDGNGGMILDERGKQLLDEVGAIVGKRFQESGDYRARLIEAGRADFKCRAGSRYLYVDELGVVHWCSQQRGTWSKPLADYTFADLREQFHTKKDCAPTCTVGCVRSASRWDEWRGQRRAYVPAPDVPLAALTGSLRSSRERTAPHSS